VAAGVKSREVRDAAEWYGRVPAEEFAGNAPVKRHTVTDGQVGA